ncbi:DNA polymerase delta subunit 2 [Calliopsis andreniformis]|uniref:DNA polymerase delta subunit 2 n=1 Tax=Calliopsis andreniformis TaxID=337506 RepID=UPI003FCD36B2
MEIPSTSYHRKSLKFQDIKRFKICSRSYERQYFYIYLSRLNALREYLQQKAKEKWGEHEIVTISELSEKNESNNCIIIGTLYKHQELKPSILRDLSKELQLTPQSPRSNYASFKDLLFLEDEVLRIKLVGNHMNIQDVVSGITCAVLGHELENGTFSVIDWCFPGCCPKLHGLQPSKIQGKILMISGLDLINNTNILSLNLLFEWISGMIGDTKTQKDLSAITCIIIAGNSVKGSVEVYNHKGYFETKAHDEVIFKEAATIAHKLDDFLYPIAKNCPIILMPGEFDPTCHLIPQQPFHPCILPQCSRFKTFHAVTNPWIGNINSCIIAGSSGQPILDIMKVAGLADVSPLTWLERTLDWRHYAPTAPDTLSAYPYSNVDPFVMMECPYVYFVGNMDKYDTKLITASKGQTTRLICIPKFSETQTAVLVDLHDLKTQPVSFGIS